MGRLIDADEYEKRIKPYDTEDIMDKALYNFAHNKLISTPSAEKTGRWVAFNGKHFCSNCGNSFDVDTCMGTPMWNYCPNCGARMVNDNE